MTPLEMKRGLPHLKHGCISIPFGKSRIAGAGKVYHLPGGIEITHPRTAIAVMIAALQDIGAPNIPAPPTDSELEVALANLFNR